MLQVATNNTQLVISRILSISQYTYELDVGVLSCLDQMYYVQAIFCFHKKGFGSDLWGINYWRKLLKQTKDYALNERCIISRIVLGSRLLCLQASIIVEQLWLKVPHNNLRLKIVSFKREVANSRLTKRGHGSAKWER